MSQISTSDRLDSLIAQLESYSQCARQQIDTDAEQTPYWRGVLFGVELALLDVRKHKSDPVLSNNFYEGVGKLVFDSFEKLLALCQVRIRRDLLVYNVRVTRYELLKAIRRQTNGSIPNDYELQANPDIPSDGTQTANDYR
jgi:hypothetical protein